MRIFFLLLFPLFVNAAQPRADVDYADFLGQHDMWWDTLPRSWFVAPYTGNGNIGFTFYQHKKDAPNQVSIRMGRHDYYDHRLPYEGDELNWIYNGRLPLGRFQMTLKGKISGAALRLDLWNAALRGNLTTSEGSVGIFAYTHSNLDIVDFHTSAKDGESVSFEWIPEVPFSSSRKTLDKGGGPKQWKNRRTAPYPLAPEPILGRQGNIATCKQILYQHRGETTTAWKVAGVPDGPQTLYATVHHSFPEKNSMETCFSNFKQADELRSSKSIFKTHQQWWHDYYPQSFLTLNDPEKEAFYWIQMYKLGSVMRENGPILDLMGPWYKSTFWPMVWGDLNVQLQYWTHLTSNRLSLGESLPNNLDKYAENLEKNSNPKWKDSANLGACFPQNCLAAATNVPPNMLAWIMHNYWLHCQFAADHERLENKFFPLLRKTMNGYLGWIAEKPIKSDDGKIHLRASWSPEYPAKWDEDTNFTIGLIRWTAQTLLDLNKAYDLNDPLVPEWQNIVDNLVDFQIDENGLRIAKNTPFDLPHRHYSHLLPFYPLAVLTPDTAEGKALLKTSLDHWLKVTKSDVKVKAMPITGYTTTGAASMYSWLGDSEQAYHYLDQLINHSSVTPTTMYAEGGNPVIESPLSFCTSLHDMLLQSWGGVIRVLPACPKRWPDLAFHQFRAQGAFLVSAKRNQGATVFVQVNSLAGSPCKITTDIPNPVILINGKAPEEGSVVTGADGIHILKLGKGDLATFAAHDALTDADWTIAPIPVAEDQKRLFGFGKRTERLPGHQNYVDKR